MAKRVAEVRARFIADEDQGVLVATNVEVVVEQVR
jgi:hypothetical protein